MNYCYFSVNRASLFPVLTEHSWTFFQINYFNENFGAFRDCGLLEIGPGFLGIVLSLPRFFCVSVSKISSSFSNIPETLSLHHLDCFTRNIFRPSSSPLSSSLDMYYFWITFLICSIFCSPAPAFSNVWICLLHFYIVSKEDTKYALIAFI